jgi:hypothetical protein
MFRCQRVSVSTGLLKTAVCKNPLVQAFAEVSRFYGAEGNYNAAATYQKISQAIRELTEGVTEDNAF